MIRYCKERGLTAQVMDFYNLDFDDNSFHAVYVLNCLLHVPKAEIHQVIKEVKRVIKPEGLYCWYFIPSFTKLKESIKWKRFVDTVVIGKERSSNAIPFSNIVTYTTYFTLS